MQQSFALLTVIGVALAALFILLVFLLVSFLRHTRGMPPSQMRRDRRAIVLFALIVLVYVVGAVLSILALHIP